MKTNRLVERTGLISLILLFVVIGQLLLTLFIGMGDGTDPAEIYVRNVSSMVALLFLAVFFDVFSTYHKPFFTDIYRKRMKTVTLLLAAASLAKAAISAVYAVTYISPLNIVLFYYLGEAVVWAAVFCFAVAYYKRLKTKKSA